MLRDTETGKINTLMGNCFLFCARCARLCFVYCRCFGFMSLNFCTKCALFFSSLFDVSVKATCVDMSMCPAGHERCCASKRVTERDLLRWDLGTPVSGKTSGLYEISASFCIRKHPVSM